MMKQNQPQWIWINGNSTDVNQYVEFHRKFDIEQVKHAELMVSVDTNFVAWINDKLVGTGQFSDFPEEKTFSRMDITDALIEGINTLTILVHYCGVDHFSYIPNRPGLWFKLQCGQMEIVSDEQTLSCFATVYRQGDMPRITPQLGFTFEYDARNRNTERFRSSVIVDGINQPKERQLPMLILKPRPEHKIIAQGLLKRIEDENVTVAQLMQQDFLSSRTPFELFDNIERNNNKPISSIVSFSPDAAKGLDGVYVIIDMGKEECGFIDIEVETSAGTIIDIAVGEHLEQMRVSAAIEQRNFASRYITCEGRQRFTHYLNRYAGRYIQIHITNLTAPLTLYYAGLIPAEYPVKMQGGFQTSDSLMNKIFEVSCRTVHLCMHEHYEDCPWREQALYAEDSRIEALINYYAFGDYEFSKVSFALLGKSAGDDGYIELCAPMRYSFTIPFEVMVWFIEMTELVLFSGDMEYAKNQLPHIHKMIDIDLNQLMDNLLPTPRGKRYWQFYDWEDGMDGHDVYVADNPLIGLRFDAVLNFFFILALRKIANLADECDDRVSAHRYRQQADLIAQSAHNKFWDDTIQAYTSYIGEQAIENHFAELTQALAILCKLPEDTDKRNALRRRLSRKDNGFIPTTLSASIYKYDAILSADFQREELGELILEQISEQWGNMLYNGATSFWETLRGAYDFAGAGSLCHGWSAVPAYIYQTYLLGVKPIEPGFRKFLVNPLFVKVPSAKGTIPTPAGSIRVSWEKSGRNYLGQLEHPASLTPVFADSAQECDWNIFSIDDNHL